MGPCKNKQCRSYGMVHPNCRCYASGGMVEPFCEKDNIHDSNCEYYAQGGPVKSSKMNGLNLSKFKKQKEDNKTVTMVHENGHIIKIMKSAISPLQRKQMERLPIHAATGAVIEGDSGDSTPQPDPTNGMAAEGNVLNNISGGTSGAGSYLSDALSSSGVPQTPPPSAIDTSNKGPDLASNEMVPGALPKDFSDSGRTEGQPSFTSPSQGNAKADPLANISLGDAYSKEMAGIRQKAGAESTLAQDELKAEQNRQADLQDAQRHSALAFMNINRNINDTLQDIKNSHINPNHYLENQTVPQKISSAIGLLLGGFTKNGVNPAQQWLNQQIDRDVMAQKNNLENKKTVYSGYLDQYKNATVADQMARATQLGIYASKVKEAAAKAGTPLAQAQLNMLSAELEQKMIPLQQNAHLISQFNQFNGGDANHPGAGKGNEAQFVSALNSAQHINPTLYADQQSKYIPSVGIATHPMAGEDRARLQSIDELTPIIDKAIALQKNYGMTGARLGMHPINDPADAESIQKELNLKLGALSNVNRLNGQVYNNYRDQIGAVGAMNFGGTLRTLQNLRSQAEMDRNSAIKSNGITPFSDAKASSGLNQKQQNNLNTFLRNNPKVDQGTAIEVLKSKGVL